MAESRRPNRNAGRLVIAAPHGKSGKTTVTLGLVAALVARGLTVQPFKKGSDYIDPGWLGKAAGRPCRNLDPFFCSSDDLVAAFARATQDVDVAVIEGNHGLYDGLDADGSASTAELARILAAPVILVVDATRMTRSVAALVRGFQDFDPAIRIAGVILNRTAGPRHRSILTASLEKYCRVPVLGSLPDTSELTIPARPSGLIPAAVEEWQERLLEQSRQIALEYLDIEAILSVARAAPDLVPADVPASQQERTVGHCGRPSRARIGYFADAAFPFYYPENLEALGVSGAELVPVSPLAGPGLPPVDVLYVGGGMPEMFAGELAANRRFRADVRQAVEAGLPVYAEGGGLLYLCRSLVVQGVAHEMAGVLPADAIMEKKPAGHGYTIVEVEGANPFFPAGSVFKGHEFHYSRLINLDRSRIRFAYRVRRGTGIDGRYDGLVYRNVLASFSHLHALAVPAWAPALVSAGTPGSVGGKGRADGGRLRPDGEQGGNLT